MRIRSPLLCAALEAASFVLVGRLQANSKYTYAGLVRYTCALRLQQAALRDVSGSQRDEVLVTAVLFEITEMLEETSRNAFLKHQLGGLDLLHLGGPSRHCREVGHSIYADARLFWVISSILHRRTFLANEDWRTVPWAEVSPQNKTLHHLLDIAVDIPTFCRQLDCISVGPRLDLPYDPQEDLLYSVQQQAEDLFQRLQEWEESQTNNTLPRPIEAFFAQRDDFPIFECKDSTSGANQSLDLLYSDVSTCTTMISYWVFCLTVARVSSPTWRY